jgi:hypothetical protein
MKEKNKKFEEFIIFFMIVILVISNFQYPVYNNMHCWIIIEHGVTWKTRLTTKTQIDSQANGPIYILKVYINLVT